MQQTVGRINLAEDRWQDQPGIRPLAGPTRQRTVGRINQVAVSGDGDEDKDEIPNYAVLLTALVKRFGGSRTRDFKNI